MPAVKTEEPTETKIVETHSFINTQPTETESTPVETATVTPPSIEPAPQPTTTVENTMEESVLEIENSEVTSVFVAPTTKAQPKTTESRVVPVVAPTKKKKRHYRRVQKNYGLRNSIQPTRKPAPQHRSVIESKPVSKSTKPTIKKPVRAEQVFGDTKVGKWMVRHVGPWIPESLKTTKPFTPSERTSAEKSSRRKAKQ